MKYSVRKVSTEDGEIDHIQFEVPELPSQQIILIGAGILFVEGCIELEPWCVYDQENVALEQGHRVSDNYYQDHPQLRSSKATKVFDTLF